MVLFCRVLFRLVLFAGPISSGPISTGPISPATVANTPYLGSLYQALAHPWILHQVEMTSPVTP